MYNAPENGNVFENIATSRITTFQNWLYKLMAALEPFSPHQWHWPIDLNAPGVSLTQPFYAYDPETYPLTGRHPGVDYGTGGSHNVTLHFVCDGEIIESGKSTAFGNYFFFYVPGVDRTFAYFHLQQPALKPGWYSGGSFCGYAGDTGLARGIHLHLECIKGRVNSYKRAQLFSSPGRLLKNAEDPHAFLEERIIAA